MEANYADLLASAISTSYGSYYGSVFSALATHSRATARNLVLATAKSDERQTPAQLLQHQKDVRTALATLVQLHLVRHHIDKVSGQTFYEPNWEHAYNLIIRAPTLFKLVQARFDTQVAEVFDSVLRCGMVRVGDLVPATTPEPASAGADKHDSPHSKKSSENGDCRPNGIGHQLVCTEAAKEVYGALHLLLRCGLLMPVNLRQFWPPYELKQEAIATVSLAEYPEGVSQKKERDAVADKALKLERTWRAENHTYMRNSRAEGRKRLRSPEDEDEESDAPPAKRHRFNSQLPNETNTRVYYDQHEPLDADLVLAVNFEKCNVGLRNMHFVRFADRHIGHTTSKVYDALLSVLESSIARCYDPLEERPAELERNFYAKKVQQPLDSDLGVSQPVTTAAVAEMLDPTINLDDGLSSGVEVLQSVENGVNGINGHVAEDQGKAAEDQGKASEDQGQGGAHETTGSTTDKSAAKSDNNAAGKSAPQSNNATTDKSAAESNNTTAGKSAPENDNTVDRIAKVEQHLQLLVCDSRGFVITHGEKWCVPFHAITQKTIEAEIENGITSRLGMLPSRLVRILKFYGNLDLRSVMARAMVQEEPARKAAGLLQRAGYVAIQELPRNSRRDPKMSQWLYNYDVLAAREKLLADTYKAMARLHMRVEVEKKKIQRVIEKSERSDVVGKEDKYLNSEEKATLNKYAQQTSLIMRQVVRMDELVALVRDFSPMEYPHRLWDLGWVDWRRLSSEPVASYGDGDFSEEEENLLADDVDIEEEALGEEG